MVWQRQDNAYLGATVAAGALAACALAWNFGVGTSSRQAGFRPLELGHLPLPRIAPSQHHTTPRFKIVVQKKIVRVPVATVAASASPPSETPSATVGAVVAPPQATVRPVPSASPQATPTPAPAKPKAHGPKRKLPRNEREDASVLR